MALKGSQSAPVVRVPTNEPVIIKRLLDIGFYNFLIPFVETKEEAARAVAQRAIRKDPLYPFRIAPICLAFVPDYFAQSNNNISILVQIESQQGVDNVDAIAATNGVDGIFVGQAIWLRRLGHLGNAGHPDVQHAINTSLPALKPMANRAAFWHRLKLTLVVIWNGAPPLWRSAVTSAYSAQPRRN
jgi:2-dehydro-3-deoxyglucarate aldolase